MVIQTELGLLRRTHYSVQLHEDLKAEVTASLIDEVYAGVSKAHGS